MIFNPKNRAVKNHNLTGMENKNLSTQFLSFFRSDLP